MDPNTITIDDFKEKLDWEAIVIGVIFVIKSLKDLLNVNFIVLNSDDEENQYHNYPLFYDYNENIKTIILLYENNVILS